MKHLLAVCAAVISATSGVAVAGNGTNLTKYVADTTQAVMVLDVAGAKSAKLVKDSVNKLLDAQPDARAKLDEIGLEPLRDIDTIMVAFGAFDEVTNMGDSSAVMIVEGRLPKDGLVKIRAKATSTAMVNGVEVFTKNDGEVALIDGKLFFAKKGLSDIIALAKGKSKANLASGGAGKAMRDTIKRASTKMHAWGAIVLPAKDREKTVAAQLPVDAVSFAFKFSSDLEGYVRLDTPSADSAAASVTTLNGYLPQAKMFMGGMGLDVAAGTIVLAQDKASINASIKLTQTELKTLFALALKNSGGGSAPPTKSAPPQTGPTKPQPPNGGLGGTTKPKP